MMRARVLGALVLVLAGCSSDSGSERDDVEVVAALDGDTISVRLAGGEEDRVRLVGVNAPESGECFADEATTALRGLLDDGTVRLVIDQSDRDSFGRLLRYVEVDGVDAGLALVESGHAVARRHPPDTARAEEYGRAGATARDEGRGLWAPDACGAVEAGASALVFGAVNFDAAGPDMENLLDEWIRLDNTGDTAVDLTGWQVKDESSVHRYDFPDGFMLAGGASVTIRTGCGIDNQEELFWCPGGSAIWNNDGDTAFLLDPSGNVVASRGG